jgi:peptidoglycan-associated lipoprotein
MRLRILSCLAVLLCFTMVTACGKKRKPVTSGMPAATPTPAPTPDPSLSTIPADDPLAGGPDFKPIGEGGPTVTDWSPTDADGQGPLVDIHFGYDEAALSDEARATLEKHALWLQNHREAKLVIEGHCDERGTVEYNLALGEQRARAAYDYLKNLGIADDRMKIVSFGKEKPLDPGQNEAAYARNRRAHFVATR